MVRVYLDVRSFDRCLGRMVFDLFDEEMPMPCENFRALCTGERGCSSATKNPLWYVGSRLDESVPGRVLQWGRLGDAFLSDESALGKAFESKPGPRKHNTSGLLSTIPNEAGLCGSRFAITLGKCHERDGHCAVFGEIVRGYGVLREIESLSADRGGGSCSEIVISACGQLEPDDYGLLVDELGDPYASWPQDHPNMSSRKYANRLAAAAFLRQLGNSLYGKKSYEGALKKYEKANRYLDKKFLGTAEVVAEENEERKVQAECKVPVLLNIAACHLRMNHPRLAIDACNKAHDMITGNPEAKIKALWRLKVFRRRAEAFMACKEFEYAIRDLGVAQKLEPDCEEDLKLMEKAKSLLQARKHAQKEAFKSAFDGKGIF